MNTKPKISVLMPAYNAELYIAEAIESILAQTYTDYECIIIDDGSSDRTRQIIQEYASKDMRIVAVQNEENLRICKTLNKGIQLAKGVYIARMDADDICVPERFQWQVDFMDAHPDVGILGGNMDIMNESGIVYSSRTYHQTDAEIRKHIFRYSPFCHASTMYRTNIIKEVGMYNIYLHDAEDYDMYFRVGKISKFANLDKLLYVMRANKNSVTYNNLARMERLTIFLRKKAVIEYGYNMSIFDKIYTFLQKTSLLFIKGNFRVRLFNIIRN